MQYTRKSFVLFLLLSFGPVWLACAAMLLFGVPGGGAVTLLLTGFMFMPAVASILTRLICKEGFANLRLNPNFRLRHEAPRAGRDGKLRQPNSAGLYALAFLLPTVTTLLGAGLYFLCYPEMFDRGFTTLAAMGVDPASAPLLLAVQVATATFTGPLLNFIPALGEELGWRGYLQPKLETVMSARGAALVTGIIWGFWHAPMIALGHNYGTGYWGYPVTGILLMTLFCVGVGMFLSYLACRTRSAVPCALAHGGVNAIAQIGVLFCLPGYVTLIGPLPMGAVSMVPALVSGAVFCLLLKKGRPAEETSA